MVSLRRPPEELPHDGVIMSHALSALMHQKSLPAGRGRTPRVCEAKADAGQDRYRPEPAGAKLTRGPGFDKRVRVHILLFIS